MSEAEGRAEELTEQWQRVLHFPIGLKREKKEWRRRSEKIREGVDVPGHSHIVDMVGKYECNTECRVLTQNEK